MITSAEQPIVARGRAVVGGGSGGGVKVYLA